MTIGGPSALLPGVRKILVLVPHAVGDFVFTLPALHALRHAYPDAELALVGKAWHQELLNGRPGPVDKVLVLPPCPGVGIPANAVADMALLQHFLEEVRGQGFDLAVQLFGGGRYSNPLVRSFGAHLEIGARADGAPPLDRWVRYAVPNNRRLAWLETVALVGARPVLLSEELIVTDADRNTAQGVLDGANCPSAACAPESASRQPTSIGAGHLHGQEAARKRHRFPTPSARPLVVLQPGSTDPRRCWPAESFAAVGDALAEQGATIAINGAAAEAALVREVSSRMRHQSIDLSGQLSLSGLCGLLDGAALMVSNDTGPLHMALAVGTPSVGIFWFTNLLDGTPLRQHLLHAALSLRLHCPVCGAENVSSRCPHDPSFVSDVPVEQVTSMATSLLHARR
jgi:ADP-heptose:LPS heptosyltransferase